MNEEELYILNRRGTAYLELAELQALNRKPMYMKDWISRLDDFLKMTDKDILKTGGTISHQQAIEKANFEFDKYKEIQKNELSETETHFLKQIESASKKLKK